MIDIILKTIILFMSFAGLGYIVWKYLKINIAFIPIYIFSIIIISLFVFGLFNGLLIGVYTIYIIGLIGLICFFFDIKNKKVELNLHEIFQPSLFILLINVVFLLIMLRGEILSRYDNFSHWGLIVKEMLRIRDLPNSSTIITFQNYPPGSSLFIYYVTTFLENKESIYLMSHSFLTLASFNVINIFARWKKPLTILFSFSTYLFVVFFSIEYYTSLLVDVILSGITLTAVIATVYYRHEIQKIMWLTTPLLTALILIKDSGKIFFFIVLVLVLFYMIKDYLSSNRSEIIYRIMILLPIICLPLLYNAVWLKYIQLAYHSKYEENKFAITKDKLDSLDKTSKDIAIIKDQFFGEVLNINNSGEVIVLILMSVSIFILIIMKEKQLWIKGINIYISMFTIYSLYMLLLYVMYIYMMPKGEALYLASFDRYQFTIIILFISIISLFIVYLLNSIKSKLIKILVLIIIGLQVFYGLYIYANNWKIDTPRVDLRENVYNYLHNTISYNGEQTITYYSNLEKSSRGYFRYMLNYEHLRKPYYIVYGLNDEVATENFEKYLKESDFLIVLDIDRELTNFFKRHELNISKGVYKVSFKSGKLSLNKMH